jgi:hypothetical protein
MERNPDYFLPGVPRLDRVIIRIIPSSPRPSRRSKAARSMPSSTCRRST